jgi:hypothetical protein
MCKVLFNDNEGNKVEVELIFDDVLNPPHFISYKGKLYYYIGSNYSHVRCYEESEDSFVIVEN